MTSYRTVILKCAHCGHESTGSVLLSTNTFGGSPGLDTRACGMARLATLNAIQCCPNCHYCSSDISRIPDGVSRVIATQKYQNTFSNRSVPELCRKWACWAQVLEESQQLSRSGWAFLSAAWSCDDSRKTEPAAENRRHAIRLFEAAEASDDSFGKDSETETTILADLYRRTGNFIRTSELAQSVLMALDQPADDEKKMIQKINRFQLYLASICDAQGYTYTEAELYAKNPSNWYPPRWWEIWR